MAKSEYLYDIELELRNTESNNRVEAFDIEMMYGSFHERSIRTGYRKGKLQSGTVGF